MHNAYGVRSTEGTGNPTFLKYFNEGTTAEAQDRFTKNVINLQNGGSANSYSSRPGNFFPANWAAVKFVDQANGDYRLASDSPYKDAGTDGKDLGADIDTLSVATAGAVSGIWPQALQNVVVNGGEAQRSMVKTVTLGFNQPINSTAGALSLSRRGGSGVNVVATPSADKKTYTLTFTGAGITAGSLQDGVYDFLADVSEFRDAFNQMPVGTWTDQDETLALHRLFGDSDGDKDVDGIDSLRFRQAQGSTLGSSAYRYFFDFDGDSDVDGVDSLRFRQRQGLVYSY